MSIRLNVLALLFTLVACTDSSTPAPSDPLPDASEQPEPPDAPPVEESCSHCGGVTDPATFDPANLCEESQPLFDAVIGCVCGVPDQQAGKCFAECGATVCDPANGGPPDEACMGCIAVQCGPETGACLNDL